MTKYLRRMLLIIGSFTPLIAQGTRIVSAGYEVPTASEVAPGQVITFYVEGIGRSLTGPVRAASASWPTELAGISVTFRQGTEVPVPIFEVRPVTSCPTAATGAACIPLTAVTVQIPYDLPPICPLCATLAAIRTQVVVTENGSAVPPFDVIPVANKIHILTLCDQLTSGGGARGLDGFPCAPVVTHANGTFVSANNPARQGEEVVAWAYGLGQTSPTSKAGVPAPTALPTAATLNLDFNFHLNALAARPTPIIPPPFALPINRPVPLFAGLVQGMVGLYQINFTIPAIPPGTILPCTDPTQASSSSTFVQSNLTVSFGSNLSFDGAPICVALEGL